MCIKKYMRRFGAFPTLRLHWQRKHGYNRIRYFCFHFPNRSFFRIQRRNGTIVVVWKRWWKETFSIMGEANRKKNRITEKRVYWYRIPLTMPHLFQVHYSNCPLFLCTQCLLSFSFAVSFHSFSCSFTLNHFQAYGASTLFYLSWKRVKIYMWIGLWKRRQRRYNVIMNLFFESYPITSWHNLMTQSTHSHVQSVFDCTLYSEFSKYRLRYFSRYSTTLFIFGQKKRATAPQHITIM